MCRPFLILLFLFLGPNFFSQSGHLDSLIILSEQLSKKDSINIELVEKIINGATSENIDSIRIKHKDIACDYYERNKNLSEYIRTLSQELKTVENSKNLDKKYISRLRMLIGYYLNVNGNPLESIEYYKKLYYLGDDIDNDSLLNLYYRYVCIPQSVNYAQLADYENAILLQEKPINYFIEKSIHGPLINAYNNLGEYYELQNDLESSIEYYNKILNYSNSPLRPFDKGTAIVGLCKIALKKSQLDKAIKLGQEAIVKVNTSRPSPKLSELKIDLFITLSNLYSKAQDPKNSIFYGEKAVIESKEYYGEIKHRRLAHLYNNLAQNHTANQDYTSAIENYKLALKSLPANQPDVQVLASYDGLISAKSKQTTNNNSSTRDQEILQLIDSLIINFELIRKHYINDNSRYFLADYVEPSLAIGMELCQKNFKKSSDKFYFKKGLVFSEISKAAALTDAITKYKKSKEVNPLFANKKEATTKHSDTNLDQRIHYNTLVDSILKFTETNYDGFLEYFFDDNFIYILSFYNGDCRFAKHKLSTDLNKALDKLLNALTFEKRHQFEEEIVSTLKDLLLPKSELSGKILIIPDDKLSVVAFDLLMNYPKKKNQNVQISYASSIRILNDQSKINRPELNNRILGVAPIFENQANLHLQKSEEEMKAIQSNYAATIYLKQEATKNNFLNNASNYSALHLSTHAGIDTTNESAYIRFIQESMTLDEVYNLSFNNDLVVLSACETGLGKNENTEGVLSLSRAFNYAGAPTVISSLWQVDENSTAIIFDNFYKNLSEGYSTSASLDMAKSQYRSDPSISAEYKTPFYWAGFVHWGLDAKIPLENKKSSSGIWIALSVVLAALLAIFLKSNFQGQA